MKYFFGPKNKKNYFEGWYFKHTSEHLNIAFIPSIAVVDNEKKAYIQVISNLFSECFEFSYDDFVAETKSLNIKIENNTFTEQGLNIDLKNDNFEIKGKLTYSDFLPLKYDIMGPFKYFPKMECKHNIFSMKHFVNGKISINNQEYLFINDLGYIEGDYGVSFPEKYIWIQANIMTDVAISLSIATIPYGFINFTGVIAVLIIGSKEYRFATYNFTKIIKNTNEHIKLKKRNLTLEVFIKDSDKFALAAPKNGLMTRKVHESMKATIEVMLSKKGSVIYQGIANNASVEIG